MKSLAYRKAFAPFLLTTLIPLILGLLFLSGCSSPPAEETQENTPETESSVSNEEEMKPVSVTIYRPDTQESSYLNLLGTVEADSHVRVFPGTTGEITAVNVQDGESVQKNDILFVIGGAGGVEHPSMTQYKVAQANYDAANSAYKNTIDSVNASVKSAELQLQSARHQTEGSYIDYYGMSETIEEAKDTAGLIRSSLGETQMKNERDLENLLDSLDDLEDARKEALLDLEEMVDNAPDEETKRTLEKQLEDTEDEFDTQIDTLEDQYEALQSGAILGENQILSQLQQAYAQEHSLYTTRDSTQQKLGLFDGTSDPVLLAEQGLNSAKAQSNTALTQAQTQLTLSKLNLESAADQQKLLLVKAPASGIVSNVSAKVGNTVSPQAQLTEIVGENDFVLKVGVDIENSKRIQRGKDAEVKIGGKYMKVPIQSVSPSADPMSKLVTVTVGLPKITFLSNQTVEVRLPIDASLNGESENSIFIPLDAVTIGTERQFVYIVKNGEAHQQTVKLGSINGDLVEILEGLRSSDQLIVNGAKDVTEGQSVTIQ